MIAMAKDQARRAPFALLRVLLTTLGVAGVVWGAFEPAVDVKLYGEISFVEAAGLQGILVLVFAALVLVAAVRRSVRFKVLSCAAMWVALLWPLIHGLLAPDEKPANLLSAAGHTVVGAARSAVRSLASGLVTWTHGVAVMLAGCVVVTLATGLAVRAAVRRRRAARSGS